MRTRLVLLTSVLAIGLGTLLSTTVGCEFFGLDEDDFQLRFKPLPIGTLMTGYLSDARTGSQLTGTNIIFKITGPDAGKVTNYRNEQNTTFVSKGGLVSFAFVDGFSPSVSNVGKITVAVEVPGFLPAAKVLKVAQPGSQYFDLKMINVNNPPAGVFIKTDLAGQADPSGKLQALLSLQTTPDPATGAKAQFVAGQGVKLTNLQGQPLTGNLSSTLVFISNQDKTGLGAMPGGQSVTVNKTGAAERAEFALGGFVKLEIRDASGKVASKATLNAEELALKIDIPQSTLNPEKGQSVAVGDKVPVWSLDKSTWQWNKVGDVALGTKDAAGNYPATVKLGGSGKTATEVVLPSELAFSWVWTELGNLVLRFDGDGPPVPLFGRVSVPGSVADFVVPPGPLSGGEFVIAGVPCNVAGSELELQVAGTSTVIKPSITNLCTTIDIDVTEEVACPNKLEFEVFGDCDGDVQIRQANQAFLYYDTAVSPVRPLPGAVEEGIVRLCVQPSRTYRLYAVVEGEQFSVDLLMGPSIDSFSFSNPSVNVTIDVLSDLNADGLKQVQVGLPESACEGYSD